MKRVILCSPIYDFKERKFTIGGIQTYFRDLAEVFLSNGYDTILTMIREEYDTYEETIVDNIKIQKYPAMHLFGRFNMQMVFDHIYKRFNNSETIFIIDSDQRNIKSKESNVITIQHGIAFDVPGNMIAGFWGRSVFLQRINKLIRCLKNVNRLNYTKNTVCVDYNYFNWFRTLSTINSNIKIIPNYSSSYLPKEEAVAKISQIQKPLNIVFARRFVDYRGTLIFKDVVDRLLSEGYNFTVTFAGTGPLYEQIKSHFANIKQVYFSSFDSKDTISFHQKFDLAVVPTIYSEGTSLSLCESMCAGCIPVATHVGGMTNMILDGFNGFLCYPSSIGLYKCLKKVLEMSNEDLQMIANNAYCSAVTAFSKDKWAKEWLDFVNSIYATAVK